MSLSPLRDETGEGDIEVADGADLVVNVQDVGVALGGAVELGNVGDVEAGHELLPDLRSEAVAEHDPDLVLLLLGHHGGGHQVAGDLTDVLGALPTESQCVHVFPFC